MTPDDARMLAELADAEARATKGPWEVVAHELLFGDCVLSEQVWTPEGRVAFVESRPGMPSKESANNARLLALARNALPRLIALAREQDAALRLAAVVACAPSARHGVVMADALAGLRKALDELVPGWNDYGLAALDGEKGSGDPCWDYLDDESKRRLSVLYGVDIKTGRRPTP